MQYKIINNSTITLGDTKDLTSGRRFESRFLQPGLAGYPGQYGNALIRKENLDKFINTLINKPVIISHKAEISENDKAGEVLNVWFNPADGWYWCSGVIYDNEPGRAAQNLIKNRGWSVSCSYSYTKSAEGGTENNIPYDIEFLDGEFEHLAIVENPRYERANIVFNAKVKNFNPNHDSEGKFCSGSNANYSSYEDFIKEFSHDIERLPPDYTIADADEAKKDLGIIEGKPRIIKTPIESLELRADRLEHIINGGGDGHEPDKKRYKCINKMFAALERPNIIVKYDNGNKAYFKVFQGTDKTKNQVVSIHKDQNGDFIYTAMPADKGSSYFVKKINDGKIIYKKAAGAINNSAVNNIIPETDKNKTPDVNEDEIILNAVAQAIAHKVLEQYK